MILVSNAIDVSVVVCVRNGAATIQRQLDALDAQIEHPPFEVVVVDNGSADGTADLVRQWVGQPAHAAERITLVSSGSAPSIPHARNIGVLECSGRVIAFCNADDAVRPHWVAAMSAAVTSRELVGGRLVLWNTAGERVHKEFGSGLVATSYLPTVVGANCAVARSTLLAVGGFDESLPPYGFDDVDFSWRVQEAGFPLVYAPGAEVDFTLSDTAASVRKRFLLGQGRVLMAHRYPRYDSARYTPWTTVRELLQSAGALADGLVRHRSLDRQTASTVIANAGRTYAAMRHRVTGLPSRRLIPEQNR